MKRFILTAGLIAAAFTMGLQAQVLDARAEVPFDFWLGQKLMPAGEYSIYHLANGAVWIRGDDGNQRTSAVFLGSRMSRLESTPEGRLEFKRYGSTYFLSKIWNPHQTDGYALPKSSREKELVSRSVPSKATGIALLTK